MSTECVWCGRPIVKRDVGPTITGDPMIRWAPADRRRAITCAAPKRAGRYCVPLDPGFNP